jgi:predicted transcriptional regulator
MDKDEFRRIEEVLGLMHGEMAANLGVSEISVKRYATGAQPIPRHVARLAVALIILQREQLGVKFQKLLDKYHGDT